MEVSAFYAVSKFHNVVLGQILFGGDDLSGVEWDRREEIRRNLVQLSLMICLQL